MNIRNWPTGKLNSKWMFRTYGTPGTVVNHCSINILCLWHFCLSGYQRPVRGRIFIEKEGNRKETVRAIRFFKAKIVFQDGTASTYNERFWHRYFADIHFSFFTRSLQGYKCSDGKPKRFGWNSGWAQSLGSNQRVNNYNMFAKNLSNKKGRIFILPFLSFVVGERFHSVRKTTSSLF